MAINNTLIEKLQMINNLKVKFNIPLKNYTSFKVGGPADIFLIPSTITALKEVFKLTQKFDLPIFILGKGSNIIVGDKGFRGIIIYMGQLNKFKIKENKIVAEAGIKLTVLANKTMQAELSGLEFASSIPGSLGGALYMNAGAYEREMKDIITEAVLIDHSGQEITLNKDELELSYRHSLLQVRSLIAIKVTMKLKPGNKTQIMTLMKELNQKRRAKQPLEWPSAGSIFKRPIGYYSAPLIEKAGMKGFQIGDAKVSEKHAGFIINLGNASAQNIQELIIKVQNEVFKTSGIQLEVEPKFIGEFL